MAALYIAALIVLVAAAALGQAIRELGGLRGWASWSPAVGYAALLAIAEVTIRLPGHATTAALALGAATLVALASRRVRGALRSGLSEGAPVAVVALLMASLPYLVSGSAGIPGAGDNNDMASHLSTAWWLTTHAGPPPVAAYGGPLVTQGYPIGPHAVAAALARGLDVSLVHAFDALTTVLPALLALAALTALPAARRAARQLAALLVGVCYLSVAYLVQSAFKEVIEGTLLVAFALALRELAMGTSRAPLAMGTSRAAPRDPAAAATAPPARPILRNGLPIGVLVAGMAYAYSYPGVLWPAAGVGAALALALVVRRGRRLAELARAVTPAAAGALLSSAVLLAPEVKRMLAFADSTFASEPPLGMGNLVHAISPLQAVGIWLTSDFRFNPHPYWPTLALGALAAAALALAVIWWLGRRELAIVGTLAAAVAIYIELDASRSPYTAAKGLAVLAPLVAIALAPPLLALWHPRPRRPLRGLWLARAASLAIAIAAALSSFGALRDGLIDPTAHLTELATLRPLVAGQQVLFLGIDDFMQWELRGAWLASGPFLYSPRPYQTRQEVAYVRTAPLTFNSYHAVTLDRFRYIIEPRSAYRVSAPANFQLVRATRSYLLWRRDGPTLERDTLGTGMALGAVLRCDSSSGRALLRHGGVASIVPAPIVATPAQWRGQPYATGGHATLTLQVPAGAWDVSLQYASLTGLRLSAPGLALTLPATLDRIGPYWPAGVLVQRRSGPLTIAVQALDPSRIGRILGAPGRTPPLVQGDLPLDGLALTRHNARARTVPLQAACGRYVEWYRRA